MSSTVTVNHSKDGQSQTGYIVSLIVIACVLSTAAVMLRSFTRARILHTFGADDAVMVVAQVLTLGSAATILAESAYGMGRHFWVMPPEDLVPYMKSFYASIILYNVATCIVKISILLQFRRIFTYPLMQTLTLAGLVFEGLWATTLSILLPLSCVPVDAFWDLGVPGRCVDQLTLWYFMAAINLLTDLLVFTMPLPVIRSLFLPQRQKIMLMAIFCLGFLTCIISVYRITTLKAAADSSDPTWDNTNAAVWSLLELCIGVLAACLPTLKPLVALILPRLFRSTASGGGAGGVGVGGASGLPSRGYGLTGRSTQRFGSKSGETSSTKGIIVHSGAYEQDHDAYAVEVAGIKTGAGSPGATRRNIEMPAYHVYVTGGRDKRCSTPSCHPELPGCEVGIQTTTVVTQRVDSL